MGSEHLEDCRDEVAPKYCQKYKYVLPVVVKGVILYNVPVLMSNNVIICYSKCKC